MNVLMQRHGDGTQIFMILMIKYDKEYMPVDRGAITQHITLKTIK